MGNELIIDICFGCDDSVARAIGKFLDRWQPYSTHSRRYPIVRLIHELIDPAVASYMAGLPPRYLNYVPRLGDEVSFSAVIRRVGLTDMWLLQREFLRRFLNSLGAEKSIDSCFIATIESLMALVDSCTSKRPAKSKVRDTRLNAQRVQGFCRFCGALSELTSFGQGSDDPKAEDAEDELRLSSQYCSGHRPKLFNGTWNAAYRKATRSLAQFDLELGRLTRQSAKPATPQTRSGDRLVDAYIHHYVSRKTLLQPADKSELRDLARMMADSKLSDRKKQMLTLLSGGLNQSEIARRLGVERQAVSKALMSIPAMFILD